jgi:GNAT superfamily N-acetyltransferase
VGITVRIVLEGDLRLLAQAFAGGPWDRGPGSLEQRLALQFSQHLEGKRVLLVGLLEGSVAGHGSLVWQPGYPPFRDRGIPEIQDLNVAPQFRRRGVASRILEEAERIASPRSKIIGIAFGLHAGYRGAQRLYILRGYVPDGHGVFHGGRFPEEGEPVRLDDDLTLHLTKELVAWAPT